MRQGQSEGGGEGWKNFTLLFTPARVSALIFFLFLSFLPTLFAALGSGSARRGFVLLSLSAAALPLPLSLSFFAGYQRSVDIVRLFRIVYAL